LQTNTQHIQQQTSTEYTIEFKHTQYTIAIKHSIQSTSMIRSKYMVVCKNYKKPKLIKGCLL